MAVVTFKLGGGAVRIDASPGENLLSAARRADVAIDAPCSGSGTCGKCRVRLLSGMLDSSPARHLTDAEYAQGWRLACTSRIVTDAIIEVPDSAAAYRDRMRSADLSASGELARFTRTRSGIEASGLAFDSGLSALTISVDAPTVDDTMPDNERVARALQAATGAEKVSFCYRALKKLARVLRQGGFRARCVIDREGGAVSVLDVLPARDDAPVTGLAVDLGTTSVSALLTNLEDGSILAGASVGNGQIRYGADVISRIIESDREGGGERLQRAVIDESIVPLIRRLCASAGIAPDSVCRVCVAGNTTMNHLLLGLYAQPVRMEPYVPTFFRCDDLRASDLGLPVHPDAGLILAPNVGSYVGGDITAGCFASMLWDREELSLLIDLGTNGELVLGNREFLMTCACSAGPAFEGGDISCGMRATEGAIDSMTVDPDTWEPAYTVIGGAVSPAGLCGSGIIDCVAGLFRAKVIDGRGRFIRAHRRVRFDENGMGSYVVAFKEDTGATRDVTVNEADIDNFIRAKAAIFSATTTLLDSLDMDPGALERVYVAGGIGSGVNIDNAVAVGMLPDIGRDRFSYIGNAALIGAWAMLTSRQCRKRVDALAAGMTYLELSSQPGYMDAFVAACFLPHTDAALFPSVKP